MWQISAYLKSIKRLPADVFPSYPPQSVCVAEKERELNTKDTKRLQAYVASSGIVAVAVYQSPNQPITFVDEPLVSFAL